MPRYRDLLPNVLHNSSWLIYQVTLRSEVSPVEREPENQLTFDCLQAELKASK